MKPTKSQLIFFFFEATMKKSIMLSITIPFSPQLVIIQWDVAKAERTGRRPPRSKLLNPRGLRGFVHEEARPHCCCRYQCCRYQSSRHRHQGESEDWLYLLIRKRAFANTDVPRSLINMGSPIRPISTAMVGAEGASARPAPTSDTTT